MSRSKVFVVSAVANADGLKKAKVLDAGTQRVDTTWRYFAGASLGDVDNLRRKFHHIRSKAHGRNRPSRDASMTCMLMNACFLLQCCDDAGKTVARGHAGAAAPALLRLLKSTQRSGVVGVLVPVGEMMPNGLPDDGGSLSQDVRCLMTCAIASTARSGMASAAGRFIILTVVAVTGSASDPFNTNPATPASTCW